MLKRVIAVAGVSAAACGAIAGAAGAANAAGPPLPKATNGHKVQVVATGLGTPTGFAFGNGVVYEADGGPQGPSGPTGPGGVFAIKAGKATRLAGSPQYVGGVAFHNGTLFVSATYLSAKGAPITFQVQAWSRWNGTTFKSHKVLFTAPKGFSGLNGVAVGPDRRVYVGVGLPLDQSNDHGPATKPYEYDVLSMNTKGKALKVFASGIRQPWQIAFAPGDKNPFVTDFGQDKPPTLKAPDFLLHLHSGANYGFPQCNWVKLKACKGFTKPLQEFKSHTDLGGIGIIGKRIYLSQFGMGSAPAAIVTIPLTGGAKKTLVTGFVAPVIGLGVHAGWVYFGDLTGTAYRVHS